MTKALSFLQEKEIETYLLALRILDEEPDNEEVKQYAIESVKNLKEFLTDEEILELDGPYTEPQGEPDVLELKVILPLGWSAEDFTAEVTDQLFNPALEELVMSFRIHRIQPKQEWIDYNELNN